jgi:hypothetical protein
LHGRSQNRGENHLARAQPPRLRESRFVSAAIAPERITAEERSQGGRENQLAGAPEYHLVLRPEPSAVPPDVRLRKLLKFARRAFGLRCTSCIEVRRAGGDGPQFERLIIDPPKEVEP